MKKHRYLILVTVTIVCAAAGLFVLLDNRQEPLSTTQSDYNPNYADAIQQKNPALCQNIHYALQSGPTDSIDKIYGEEAVELCKSQAEAGYFGCECDSDTVLNNMRKR